MENKLDNSFPRIIRQLMHGHFLRVHYYLGNIELHPGQAKLLLMLREVSGLSQREICDKLNVKPSTITVMIKRMEKTNLIERKNDENDQRISRIFITQKGLEMSNELDDINEKIENECFIGFSEEEKKMATILLTKIRDNLNEYNKGKDKCEFHRDFLEK
ncbi:MAG: MarR family transcriptional regulator [Romboutsia sp.]